MGEIEQLDRPWGDLKIRGLLTGEYLINTIDDAGVQVEELHYVATAYEQRIEALDHPKDGLDGVLEHAQLEKAVYSIRDKETRNFALLMLKSGYVDDYVIEAQMRMSGLKATERPGHRMLERGIDLVRRHERGQRQLLRRVRANKGELDTPVCWRCLETPVRTIGFDCGADCPRLKPKGKTGPRPRQVNEMTVEELAASQVEETGPDGYNWNRNIPGGAYYQEKVKPAGLRRELGEKWEVSKSQ